MTEKEINKKVQEYKDTQISIAKVNARGMDFKEAFKISLVVSAICCEGFYLYVSLKKMHYGELLGGHFGGDRVTDSTELMKRKMQLDFFDKTRESYINKISKDK